MFAGSRPVDRDNMGQHQRVPGAGSRHRAGPGDL
jgi:hypothetical protein